MSFTEDELQAFTTILEQRFIVHRQEMEQALDQRFNHLRQKLEQRFVLVREELAAQAQQWLADQSRLRDIDFIGHLQKQQDQFALAVSQEAEQKQQHIESAVERIMAAQFLEIEQLLHQYAQQSSPAVSNVQPHFEAIEVQTELRWEDLASMIGKTLDERLVALNDSLQHSTTSLEQYVSTRLHTLSTEIARIQERQDRSIYSNAAASENVLSIQEILQGIAQLEHIVESMQVAMTANHALFSNRLYHHQQLPLERAHPASLTQVTPGSGINSLLSQAKERVARGLEPEIQISTKTSEEASGN